MMPLFILGMTGIATKAQPSNKRECPKQCVSIAVRNQALGEVVKTLMKRYGLVLGFEESITDRSHSDYEFPVFFPRNMETNPATVGMVTYAVSADILIN